MLTLLACAALLQSHGADPVTQDDSSISEESRQAIARMRVPDGFHVEVFASEPLLANPVAFCFDVFGRVYVAETFRHSKGVTDIRSHMDWLEDDLAIKSVADRVAMFRKHEGEAGLREGYAVETERVRRLVDTDGDGIADLSTVFADGFDDPAAGIAAGLLARRTEGGGTELWFTCIPDVWRLFDEDGDGVAERREQHSTGYGLRVALLGHDLHGLVIGPDGRMYFSIGDRGFNLMTAEGEHLVRYGTGAVFRCELDGSGLEIFCDGLRNPQELVFDEHGNLFTLDNNSDGGDKARWTWLLEGSDTGWRQAYQWVERPRSRGPWNQEKLWYPYFDGQAYYVLPPIENLTSGPSGITRYPGTGWGEEWRDMFFVCDFRGNPGYSGVYAYRNARNLSGFKLASKEEFLWDALPTDVDFGLDGDLYVSDWVSGWNQTGKGRLFRVTPDERPAGEDAVIAEVAQLLQGGIDTLADDGLVALFEHRDRRVRQEAQLALAQRVLSAEDPRAGYEHLIPALQVLREPSDRRMARLHSLWCAWHVARKSQVLGGDIPRYFIGLLFDPDAEIVAQAAKVLGDLRWEPAGRRLAPLLIHAEPRVRLHAAQALGQIGDPTSSIGPLIELLASDGKDDPWIRTAVICALEELGNPGAVHELLTHESSHVRQALTVVLRRWNDGAIAAMLDDESAAVRAEAARAIYDARIESAMGPLAAFLERAPDGTDDLTWRRSVHANREVASADSARRLADLMLSSSSTADVRREAGDVLIDWLSPKTRDGILMDHRPIPAGTADDLAGLVDHPVLTAEALVVSEGELAVGLRALRLHRALVDAELQSRSRFVEVLVSHVSKGDVPLAAPAYSQLLELAADDELVRTITRAAIEDPKSPLRSIAFGQLEDAEAARQLTLAAKVDDPGQCAEAIEIFGTLRGPVATTAFGELGAELARGSSGLLVEWLAVAAQHPDEGVRSQATAMEDAWASSEQPLARWLMCIDDESSALADRDRGRQIFTSKSETSCMKCHIVGEEGGSEAGPVMDGIGSRLTAEQILAAIVTPNAEIAEGFESWILMTTDDETFSGRILEETDELLVLQTNKKEEFEFGLDEIKVRRRDVSSMPEDVSSHLSRREMRDVIAYLASLRD